MPIRRFALSVMLGAFALAATTLALPGAAASSDSTACSAKQGCEAKFCRIQAEIDQAQAHGNTRKAAGLKKALDEARASCTDAGLAADRADDIRDKEDEVKERQEDLREAQADGRQRKIERAERKLKEAQDELAEARRTPN